MKSNYDIFIIEGIDRLGKDLLIKNLQHMLGFHFVIHYQKPERLLSYAYNLELYQRESFVNGFEMIRGIADSSNHTKVIFNRFHLGENVYAPLYRDYDGNYVFDFEKQVLDNNPNAFDRVKLVLLTTSDFSFIKDDGESFDFSKKGEEQEMFKTAFNKSLIRNKAIIDVCDGQGGFKDAFKIAEEVIS